MGSGGALYIYAINCSIDIGNEVVINKNRALIGGGIRILNYDSAKLNTDEIKK